MHRAVRHFVSTLSDGMRELLTHTGVGALAASMQTALTSLATRVTPRKRARSSPPPPPPPPPPPSSSIPHPPSLHEPQSVQPPLPPPPPQAASPSPDGRPAKRARLQEPRTPAVFRSRRESSGLAAALAAPTPPGLTTIPSDVDTKIDDDLPRRLSADSAAIRSAMVRASAPRLSTHILRTSSGPPALAPRPRDPPLPPLVLSDSRLSEPARVASTGPTKSSGRRVILAASAAPVFAKVGGPPAMSLERTRQLPPELPEDIDLSSVITINDLVRRDAELRRDIQLGKHMHDREIVQHRLCQSRTESRVTDQHILEIEQRIAIAAKIRADKERQLQGLKDLALDLDDSAPERPDPNANHWHTVYWQLTSDDEDDELDDPLNEKKITVEGAHGAFAPLTRDSMKRVRQSMADYSNQNVRLSDINGCCITGEYLRRLKPNCWLNDEIVNAFMTMLEARATEMRGAKEPTGIQGAVSAVPNGVHGSPNVPKVKIMNSFFYAKLIEPDRYKRPTYNYQRVRRWTRKFDSFGLDILLLPINQENVHWTLGVINFRERTVQHLDSLGTGGSGKVREYLMRWVADEAKDKGKEYNASEWKAVEADVPIQRNSDDCGVFLCKFADFLSRGWSEFTFSQTHMQYFRCRIAHELLVGKVL